MFVLRIFRGFLIASLLAASTVATAQDFPSRPIRIVLPYPPGGGPDIVLRTIGKVMSESLGQTILVENNSGGGGVPAILQLKNAAADGYTLLLPDSSLWAVYPALRTDAPYDPVKDFAPIGLVFTTDFMFYASADLPVKGISDLVALSKSRSLKYGVAGVGSIHHIAGEALKQATGMNIDVIPYRGSGQALLAVLAGEVDFGLVGWSSIVSHVQEGKVRPLAASMLSRSDRAPDVPTVAETVVPGFNFGGQFGLVAREGTPAPVVGKLSSALNQALVHPTLVDLAKTRDYLVSTSTPSQFGEIIRADVAKYAQVTRQANIKLD